MTEKELDRLAHQSFEKYIRKPEKEHLLQEKGYFDHEYLFDAFKKGFIEGFKIGYKETQIKSAKLMLKYGFPLHEIALCTKLDQEVLENLKRSMEKTPKEP